MAAFHGMSTTVHSVDVLNVLLPLSKSQEDLFNLVYLQLKHHHDNGQTNFIITQENFEAIGSEGVNSFVERFKSNQHEVQFCSPANGGIAFVIALQPLTEMKDLTIEGGPAIHPDRSQTARISKARAKTIPRPMNCFIHFRKSFHANYKRLHPEMHCTEISKKASHAWAMADPGVKKIWQDIAHQSKLDHQLKYPDYNYNPKNGESKKKRGRKQLKNAIRARQEGIAPLDLDVSATQLGFPAATGAAPQPNVGDAPLGLNIMADGNTPAAVGQDAGVISNDVPDVTPTAPFIAFPEDGLPDVADFGLDVHFPGAFGFGYQTIVWDGPTPGIVETTVGHNIFDDTPDDLDFLPGDDTILLTGASVGGENASFDPFEQQS